MVPQWFEWHSTAKKYIFLTGTNASKTVIKKQTVIMGTIWLSLLVVHCFAGAAPLWLFYLIWEWQSSWQCPQNALHTGFLPICGPASCPSETALSFQSSVKNSAEASHVLVSRFVRAHVSIESLLLKNKTKQCDVPRTTVPPKATRVRLQIKSTPWIVIDW